ncbi:opioid growth factor receptor 2 [Danio rerio]|uniref:Opioid growth factor receptor 2 n=1 Tax=Danio rerio TaxID=7955 RepID=A0A8M1NAT7_DANRE
MESDDDCDCELDSTWEDEDENKTPNEKLKKSRRNMYAAKDMQDFRHRCLELDDDYEEDYTMEKEDDAFQINPLYHLKFYRGEIKAAPVAIHIDGFHKDWWGQYDLLEKAHYYIQWLFPIQRKVNNWRIHCLRKKEIMLFRRDEDVKHKLIKSYKVMLDFYGIRLADEKTGKVERAENWKQRFNNLNRNTHNNLRITRILKCLGTLGLEHYQAPLVKFFLHETLFQGQLKNVKQSVLDYFMFAVLDKSKRRELIRYAYLYFKPRKDFVWGSKKILKVKTYPWDCHHEMTKIHASLPPEEMGSDNKNDDQKDDAVSQNRLKGECSKSSKGN